MSHIKNTPCSILYRAILLVLLIWTGGGAFGCRPETPLESRSAPAVFRSSASRPYPLGEDRATVQVILPTGGDFAESSFVELVTQGDYGRGGVGRLTVGVPNAVVLPLGANQLVCMLGETVYFLGEIHATGDAGPLLHVLDPQRAGLVLGLDVITKQFSGSGFVGRRPGGVINGGDLFISPAHRDFFLPAGWWRLYLRTNEGAVPLTFDGANGDFRVAGSAVVDVSEFAAAETRLPLVDVRIAVDGLQVPFSVLNLRVIGTLLAAGLHASSAGGLSFVVGGKVDQPTFLYSSIPGVRIDTEFDVRDRQVASVSIDARTTSGWNHVPIRVRCGGNLEPVSGLHVAQIRDLDRQVVGRTVWLDEEGYGVVPFVPSESFLGFRLAGDQATDYEGEVWLPAARKDNAGHVVINLRLPEIKSDLGSVLARIPPLKSENLRGEGEPLLVNMTPLQRVAWRDHQGPIDMMRRLAPGAVEQESESSLLHLGQHAGGDYVLEVIAPGHGIWSRAIRVHDAVGCAVEFPELGTPRSYSLELGADWAGAAAFDIDLEWSMAAVLLKALQDFDSLYPILQDGAGWALADGSGRLSILGWDANVHMTLIHPVAGIKYIVKPPRGAAEPGQGRLEVASFGSIEGVLEGVTKSGAERWAIGLSSQYRRLGGVDVPCPAELPVIPVDDTGRFVFPQVKRGYYQLVPFSYERTDRAVAIKYADRSMVSIECDGTEHLELAPIEIR